MFISNHKTLKFNNFQTLENIEIIMWASENWSFPLHSFFIRTMVLKENTLKMSIFNKNHWTSQKYKEFLKKKVKPYSMYSRLQQ